MEKDQQTKKITTIIIVLLILISVATVWYIKNAEKENDQTQLNSQNQNPNNLNQALNQSQIPNDPNNQTQATYIPLDFQYEVKTKIDLEKLKSYNVPIILSFGAEGCPACQIVEPILKELNEELKLKAIIKIADVWKKPTLAIGYPVELIPTQVFIDSEGKPYTPKENSKIEFQTYKDNNGNHAFTTHTGVLTKEQLLQILNEMGMKNE